VCRLAVAGLQMKRASLRSPKVTDSEVGTRVSGEQMRECEVDLAAEKFVDAAALVSRYMQISMLLPVRTG
jgi:hypothetical protein